MQEHLLNVWLLGRLILVVVFLSFPSRCSRQIIRSVLYVSALLFFLSFCGLGGVVV